MKNIIIKLNDILVKYDRIILICIFLLAMLLHENNFFKFIAGILIFLVMSSIFYRLFDWLFGTRKLNK